MSCSSLTNLMSHNHRVFEASLREWSFIIGRGCWEISACIRQKNFNPISVGAPLTNLMSHNHKVFEASLREWSFITGRGCWEISARVRQKNFNPILVGAPRTPPPRWIRPCYLRLIYRCEMLCPGLPS